MCRELNSTNSMGIDQDSNPQPFDCKAQTLTITPCCYPNCESVWGIPVSFTIVTNFHCTIATIVKHFPASQFFGGKIRHLWLLDFLNVIELTVVNGISENFQDLDNKQSFWLAMFTEDHQRGVFAYALDQFYYTTNLIKSEYFWSFWFLKWPRLAVRLLSQCDNNSPLLSNLAMMLWDLVYEWTGTHALGYDWLVSTSLV